jgi:hypothetical protein
MTDDTVTRPQTKVSPRHRALAEQLAKESPDDIHVPTLALWLAERGVTTYGGAKALLSMMAPKP